MNNPVPFNNGSEADAPQTMVYTVDLGDGRVADVEGPPNATPDQLHAIVSGGGQEDSPTYTAPADPTLVQADRLNPDDEAALRQLYHTGTADQIQAFLHTRGRMSDPAVVADYIAKRDGGKPVADEVNYAGKQVETTGLGAFARGADQGLTLGLGDEAHGFLNGVGALLHGNSYRDAYNSTVDSDRALLGSDGQNHGLASFAGNIAGGAVLPFGLAKVGLTPAMEAVALKAGGEAVAAGASADAAKVIAARAVARRMAVEGAGYGGVYGAGSAEGGPGERLLGGAVGAGGGALIGAATPYASAALARAGSSIGAAGRNVLDHVTTGGAVRRAGNLLGEVATDPGAALAAIAARPEPTAGTAPTLAEVAGDTGLAGFQRGVVNTDLVNAPSIAERQQQNALARTAAASDQFGAGVAQDLQDFGQQQVGLAERATAAQQAERQAAIDQRIAGAQNATATSRQSAESAQAEARSALGPVSDRDATGAEARTAFGDNYEAAKARTRAAYNVPALAQAQPVAIPESFWKKVGVSLQKFYGDAGGYVPQQLSTILDDAAREGGNTRALANVDRRLADFAGEAKMGGRGKEAAFAETVRSDLANVAQKHAPQEFRDALANAKAMRAEQGRVFETGDAPKAFAVDRFGNPTVGDNAVSSRLVRPGAAGGDTADGLIAAIGPDASEGVVRQEMRRLADEANGGRGIAGENDAQALATRYGEAARRFPSVQRDLAALTAHGRNLDAAREAESAAMRASATADEAAGLRERSALEDAIRNTPLAGVADARQDPTSFVARSLNRDDNGRSLRQLYNQVQASPQAADGFRRALGDYIVNAGAGSNFTASGDLVPSVAKTRKAISAVISRAGPALDGQQKMVLSRINRELENLNFAYTASKPAGSETAMNQTFKHFVSKIPLVGKALPMLSHVIAALDNSKDVNKLINRAILDPDFAATLLKRPTPKHLMQIQHGMMGRKVSTALTLASEPFVEPRFQAALSAAPNRAAAQQGGGDMGIANGQDGQQQPEYQGTTP